jgi:hypothetical protein
MKLLEHVDTDVTKTKFTLLIPTGLPLTCCRQKNHIQYPNSDVSSGGGALLVVADFWLVAPQPHYHHLQREEVVTQNDNEHK